MECIPWVIGAWKGSESGGNLGSRGARKTYGVQGGQSRCWEVEWQYFVEPLFYSVDDVLFVWTGLDPDGCVQFRPVLPLSNQGMSLLSPSWAVGRQVFPVLDVVTAWACGGVQLI